MAKRQLGRLSARVLPVLFLLSFISLQYVRTEPGPADLLFACLAGLIIFAGFHRSMKPHIAFPLALILITSTFGLTNVLFQQLQAEAAVNVVAAVKVTLLRFYFIGVFLAGLFCSKWLSERQLRTVLVASGALSSLIVLAGVGELVGIMPRGLNLLAYSTRLKGFYKDPNVYGPFATFLSCLFLSCGIKSSDSRARTALFLFASLAGLGVVLSLSRAAIGAYFVSICMLAWILRSEIGWRKVAAVGGFISIILGGIVAANWSFVSERLSVDSSDSGRFSRHTDAILQVINRPWGVGLGQSEFQLGYATHNTVLRIAAEGGVLSLVAFLLLGLAIYFSAKTRSVSEGSLFDGFRIGATCYLIGYFVTVPVVDSVHWRHVWLAAGIIASQGGISPIFQKSER